MSICCFFLIIFAAIGSFDDLGVLVDTYLIALFLTVNVKNIDNAGVLYFYLLFVVFLMSKRNKGDLLSFF
jgi:hypothetical protein